MRQLKLFFLIIILLTISIIAPANRYAQADTEKLQVNKNTDDCILRREDSEYWSTTDWISVGDLNSDNYDFECGARFESINIPQGSVIVSAYLNLTAQGLYGNAPTAIIEGEDAGDTVTYSTSINYKGRPRTDKSVNWLITEFNGGTTYLSPDIKEIVQEIVDRGDWSSGNAMAFFLSHELGWAGATERAVIYPYPMGPENAPRLEITWTVSITPPSIPDLLFGAGFNATSPYVELHWNHSLIDVQFFEVQNSSDASLWTYLGQSTTTNYTDTQVVNGTERYYVVRACNQTGGTWYNSSWTGVNFEKVYFIPDTEEAQAQINIPQIDAVEVNTTIAGEICGVTGKFSDVEGLAGYIFWNNATNPPSGVNSSFTALTGVSDSALENITLPSSGNKLGVKYYVNDTSGNWAVDTLMIFPTVGLWGDFTCVPQLFNVSSIEVIVGTLNDGNLASTYFVDNDWYNVSEDNADPGFDVRFNFTDLGDAACGCIEIFYTYTGHSHHDITVEVWNFTSSSWHIIGSALYNETMDWGCFGIGHTPKHSFRNGEMWFRFYHEGIGHVSHELHIERIDLRLVQAEECPSGNGAVTIIESDFPWIALAIILMCVAYLLFRSQ